MSNKIQFDTSPGIDRLRYELLNKLILGTGAITLFSLLLTIITGVLDFMEHTVPFYFSVVIINCVLFILYGLNRKGNVMLAGILFVVLLSASFFVADLPEEILAGRSLFMFIFPILVSSFVLRPDASFLVAALLTATHIFIWFGGIVPIEWDFSPFGMVAFFAFALVAWLAARNLEEALNTSYEVNKNLDNIVSARTAELAQANERLKELDKMKDIIVSNVTHELRTPISNISIYAEMLGEILESI